MDIGPLRDEQRKVSDQFQAAKLQDLKMLLAMSHDLAARLRAETALAASVAEVQRLVDRQIELDASITVLAMRFDCSQTKPPRRDRPL